MPMQVDVSYCPSPHSLLNKLGRVLWGIVWLILYRPSPKIFHGWRCFLLRMFGAKIGKGVHVYPSAKVWAPWNLEMGNYSCISYDVDCYCADKIRIGSHATVSQYSFLCTASHDYTAPHMPLTTAPIVIGDGAWIAADVYIAPGATIGEGAVVGVRSSVYKDVESWAIVAGNPARFIRKRELQHKFVKEED